MGSADPGAKCCEPAVHFASAWYCKEHAVGAPSVHVAPASIDTTSATVGVIAPAGSAVTDFSKFVLLVCATAGAGSCRAPVDCAPANAAACAITGLAAGTAYNVSAVGVWASGTSERSTAADFTTQFS